MDRTVRRTRVSWAVWGTIAMICVGGAISGSLGGCVGVEDLAAARDDARELHARLDARADQLELNAGGAPEGSPARSQEEAFAASVRAQADGVGAAVTQLDAIIRETNSPTEPLSRAVTELSMMLPEPARSPIVLGGAILALLLRARQLKTALHSVAKSMDKAMEQDEAFRARFRANADTFRTIQTPAAKRIVDEATREGFMMRLPI